MLQFVLGMLSFVLLLDGSRGLPSSRCSLKYDAFNQCADSGGGLNGTSACYSCVSAYYENVLGLDLNDIYQLVCVFIDDETCDALSSCASTCASCEPEFITYFECESLCSLNGTSCKSGGFTTVATAYPTASPTPPDYPTASPTPLQCPEERGAFNQCIEEAGAPDDCITCINAYTPDTISSCAFSEQLVCSLSSECPICAACQAEWTIFTNCLNLGSCSAFTCGLSTVSPTAAPAVSSSPPTASPFLQLATAEPTPMDVPPACRSLEASLETCLRDQVTTSQADSCPRCVEDAYQRLVGGSGGNGGDSSTSRSTGLTCSTIQSGLCDATTSPECDCGPCASTYQALLKCRVEQGDSETGCTLSCAGTNPNPSTSSATATVAHVTVFATCVPLLLASLLFM